MLHSLCFVLIPVRHVTRRPYSPGTCSDVFLYIHGVVRHCFSCHDVTLKDRVMAFGM